MSESFSTLGEMGSSYPNVTHLHIQNPNHKGLENIHLFRNMTSLVIDNSSQNEALKRMSQVGLKWSSFSDESLKFLEKCPKLKELVLLNVNVSQAAIIQLNQKMPHLKIFCDDFANSPLPPLPVPCASAEATFKNVEHTLKDGKYSVRTKITRNKVESVNKDVVAGSIGVQLKTANGIDKFKIPFEKKKIDPQQIVSVHIEGDLPVSGIPAVCTEAPNLQDLTLCNISKERLVSLKELTKFKTITIDNSSVHASARAAFLWSHKRQKKLKPVDQTSLFALSANRNFKQIHLKGCDGISDEAIAFANSAYEGKLTVKRIEQNT